VKYKQISIFCFISIILLLSSLAIINIDNTKIKIFYFFFSFIFNFYFLFTITFLKSLFLVILSIYLWLGFYLKLTLKYIFYKKDNIEVIDYFLRLQDADKETIYLLSIFICFILILVNFFFKPNYQSKGKEKEFFINLKLYKNIRFKIISFIFFIYLIFIFTNLYFGFYRRGVITEFYFISYLYSFSFQLFLPSIFLILLNYEFEISKKKNLILILYFFFIIFLSDLTISSRQMAFTGFCMLFIYLLYYFKPTIKKNIKICFTIFTIIFLGYLNISIVEYVRKIDESKETNNNLVLNIYKSKNDQVEPKKIIINKTNLDIFADMFLNRFIGIDKLSSIIIKDNKNEKLIEALNYEFKTKQTNSSYYDWFLYKYNVGHSYYVDNQQYEKLRFNNVIGVIGYLFLSKSFLIVLSVFTLLIYVILHLEKFLFNRYNYFWLSFWIMFFVAGKLINLSSVGSLLKNFLAIGILLIVFEIFKFLCNKFYYSRN